MKIFNNPEGNLYNSIYDDCYYSINDGLLESRHVFIDGNDLETRFQNSNDFVIAETGFGTGLNFLTTYNLWNKSSKPNSHLTYIAFEKHPFKKSELVKILSGWDELKDDSLKLLSLYCIEDDTPECYCLEFKNEGVSLELWVGDMNIQIHKLKPMVDAWYLDGFAPEKNPQMWSTDLFKKMGEKTKNNGTFSTYTAAGVVKQGLRKYGFFVKRFPGYGKKRHMIKGYKLG